MIDLRSGFSELSAPYLYDPRVHKILISSSNIQSVLGMNKLLEKMGNISNIYPFFYGENKDICNSIEDFNTKFTNLSASKLCIYNIVEMINKY